MRKLAEAAQEEQVEEGWDWDPWDGLHFYEPTARQKNLIKAADPATILALLDELERAGSPLHG